MRRLFLLATGLFWLCVFGIWVRSATAPDQPVPAPAPLARAIVAAELSAHSTQQDCWMAIEGKVYDITAYLPEHPTKPSVILPWCGREATEAYRTKLKGKPHSAEATALLRAYEIGSLVD